MYWTVDPPNNEISSFFCWWEPSLSMWLKKTKSINYLSKKKKKLFMRKIEGVHEGNILSWIVTAMWHESLLCWHVISACWKYPVKLQSSGHSAHKAAVPGGLVLLCEWVSVQHCHGNPGSQGEHHQPSFGPVPSCLPRGCPARHREPSREGQPRQGPPAHGSALTSNTFSLLRKMF